MPIGNDIRHGIQEYVRLCQEQLNEHFATSILQPDILSIAYGRRYAKVIRQTDGGKGQISVFGFVDMTNGDILKAATWHAPAKTARGNVLDVDFGMSRTKLYGPEYLK
jgi:hypothetical protein